MCFTSACQPVRNDEVASRPVARLRRRQSRSGGRAPGLDAEARDPGPLWRRLSISLPELDTVSKDGELDLLERLQRMTMEKLVELRSSTTNPVLISILDALTAAGPTVSCSPAEVKETKKRAEAARKASLPFVRAARLALTRLHSAWVNHKSKLIGGVRTATGTPVCAFDSNFNVTQRDKEWGRRHISVEFRLKALERKLSKSVKYVCAPITDPECTGENQDTVAYVRGPSPPIHFCWQFRTNPDSVGRQATVLHEFAHLVPGVTDKGGYALGGFGAQTMTCKTGVKFSAKSGTLVNNADALTGFVMHIGQKGKTKVSVR